ACSDSLRAMHDRRAHVRAVAARAVAGMFLAAVASATAPLAVAGDRSPPPARANLRDAAIADLPTTISVAIDAERSLVVAVPGRLFQQCPHFSTVPATLD